MSLLIFSHYSTVWEISRHSLFHVQGTREVKALRLNDNIGFRVKTGTKNTSGKQILGHYGIYTGNMELRSGRKLQKSLLGYFS